MLKENLTCIQCEVDRDCLPYMKYMKEGNNNSFKHGKGCCKEDIDKFFLHTYPRFALQHCRCRLITSCENSCNMTCKEPPECQQWDICLKWLNSCPKHMGLVYFSLPQVWVGSVTHWGPSSHVFLGMGGWELFYKSCLISWVTLSDGLRIWASCNRSNGLLMFLPALSFWDYAFNGCF